jgi:fumarate reductase subunit D
VKDFSEPFWWALFAAGGMVAALFMPAHLLVTCLLHPLGFSEAPSHEEVQLLFSHGAFRLYLIVLLSLPLFHWAHRFRAAFNDLGLRAFPGPVAVCLYGSAFAGTIWAVVSILAL